jgi:hypothetical protein
MAASNGKRSSISRYSENVLVCSPHVHSDTFFKEQIQYDEITILLQFLKQLAEFYQT